MSKSIREWQQEVHALAIEKGWYEGKSASPTEILSRLMLVVTEIAEAAEEVRSGRGLLALRALHAGKPEGFSIELADAVIRILDLAEWIGVDMDDMMQMKHNFNRTRPARHNKVA